MSITADQVSCVIPTRGNVDLTLILESLPFNDVIVWNNSREEDFGIFGRYAAIARANHDVIATQDDDLIVTCWPQILEAYEPGVLTVNYPEPWDIPWVARGAIFDSMLPYQAFVQYWRSHPLDRDFTHWICDGVFAELTQRRKVVDFGSEDLPWCNDGDRISSQGGEWYNRKRPLIKERCPR